MKINGAVLALVCFLAGNVLGQAQEAKVNPLTSSLIEVGFSDFRSFGYSKAFQTWAFGGPLQQDSNFFKAVGNSSVFWNSLGRCLGFERLDSVSVSQRSTLVYAAAQFDRGEVFFRFVLYNASGRYTITSIRWATDPDELDIPRVRGYR